jgi:exopolysaccharide biosynthesis WecB/TagA/CpsF family protein
MDALRRLGFPRSGRHWRSALFRSNFNDLTQLPTERKSRPLLRSSVCNLTQKARRLLKRYCFHNNPIALRLFRGILSNRAKGVKITPSPLDATASLASATSSRLSTSAGEKWNGQPSEATGNLDHKKRISLMGVPIDSLSEKEAIDRIITDWRRGAGGWLVTPNIDHLRILSQCPKLKSTIADRATLMLADGAPLVWASWLGGTALPERVPGSQLILSLSAAAAKAGASIFLLGGNPGIGEQAATQLATLCPGLKIAGITSPPLGFELDPEAVSAVIGQVVAAKPDIVYSCFGFPKQEWVIQQLQPQLPGTWFLGLGGSFSMIAGEFRRAPQWMQKAGLEWVCRLAQEPRRLFKRYVVCDAPFAFRLFASALRDRWNPDESKGNRTTPTRRPQRILSSATSLTLERVGINRLQELDTERRERILSRYSSIGLSTHWRQVSARLKQFIWISYLRSTHLIKRLMDITGAVSLMTLLSPLLLIFAVLVKVTSAGPVFFKQKRVGEKGRRFQMYKFRSMYKDSEERLRELLPHNEIPGGVIFKIKNDPRITPIGAVMRRWSIDELPQLWNVLKGDMSLVGPRPPLPSEVKSYTLPQRRRLDATPGLTCTWQVSGRCDIPFERQVELDVNYIECQSLKLDLKLLFQTVIAVLQHRGAY